MHPISRGSLIAVSMTAIAISLMALGCKTTGGAGIRPARATVSPTWSSLSVNTLAYLGGAGATITELDRTLAEDLIERDLRSGQNRFVVLGASTVRERARSAGVADALDRCQKAWRSSRKVDPLVAKQLCEKFGVDGLILADISDWRKEKVAWDEQGASFTEVSISLTIVSARDGEIVWQAEKRDRAESAAYMPGQGGSGVFEDGTGAQRAERPSRLTPDPPPIEPLAERVVAALLAAFPPKG